MKINMIVAMDTNYLIGQDNGLPWRLPKDLKHFKNLTTGNVVIMGRNTFESIGRPLPNRVNVVITTDGAYDCDGITVVHSMEQAFDEAEKYDDAEVFIAGGANLYKQMLPMADRLYITEVDGEFEGDAWFPRLNMAHWDIVEEEKIPADENNTHSCTFYTLDRNTTQLTPQ